MKSKLLLLIFVLVGAAWALAVTFTATQNGFTQLTGIALGTFGGFMIGALGLRMYAIIKSREDTRNLQVTPRVPVSVAWDDTPAPFEQSHREPYIVTRSVIR